MSSGLAVALPLVQSDIFGAYRLNTTFADLAIQNLKMLVLTNPGERMMDPSFGVGIRQFIFENPGPTVYGELRSRIQRQAKRYLSYINIDGVEFSTPSVPELFPNDLQVRIKFTIIPLQTRAILSVEANQPI